MNEVMKWQENKGFYKKMYDFLVFAKQHKPSVGLVLISNKQVLTANEAELALDEFFGIDREKLEEEIDEILNGFEAMSDDDQLDYILSEKRKIIIESGMSPAALRVIQESMLGIAPDNKARIENSIVSADT